MPNQAPGRSREEYLSFLETKISEAKDEAEQAVLASLVEEAKAYSRSLSPLASLARLVEACDAITSSQAADLAQSLKMETDRLRLGRTPLNSRTIDAYVRLRAEEDQRQRKQTEWTGPRDATIRRSASYRAYIDVRRDALISKPRPSGGSKRRRVEEIVGAIADPEDRQDLRLVLDRGFTAERKLRLLQKWLEESFPGIIPGEPQPEGPPAAAGDGLSGETKQALAILHQKIVDPEHLRHFGLAFDGKRLKLAQPPGTPFIQKSEMEALLAMLERSKKL